MTITVTHSLLQQAAEPESTTVNAQNLTHYTSLIKINALQIYNNTMESSCRNVENVPLS